MFISLFSVGVGVRGFCFPVGWAPLGGLPKSFAGDLHTLSAGRFVTGVAKYTGDVGVRRSAQRRACQLGGALSALKVNRIVLGP